MKKLLFFLFCACVMSTSSYAWELVPLTVSECGDNNLQPIGNGNPKAPMLAPTVYIEDYTLLFTVDHPEYILNIKDEDDNVVYSTVVCSTDTQVILPSYLSGDYKIQLITGFYCFYGYINL